MRITYTISKYLIKNFLTWFCIILFSLGLIFALFDLAELLRRVPEVDGRSILIAKMLIYRLPNYVQEMMPFMVLFSAITMFFKLNKNQELIAMRSSLLSIWDMLIPLVCSALLIGLFDLIVLNPVFSKMLAKYYNLESIYIYKNRTPFSVANSGLWIRENHNDKASIINAKHFDLKKRQLYNLSIYRFSTTEKFIDRFDAKMAYLDKKYLKLYQVWHTEYGGFPKFYEVYLLPTDLSLQTLRESFYDPKTLSFYQVIKYAQLMEKSGLSANQYFMQWHVLMSRCVWMAVMVILAATFTMRPVRKGDTVIYIFMGFGIAFVLYFLRNVTYAMGNVGTISPFLAAWTPTIATMFLALTKLLYSEDG